jgi:RND family efflux transporter MFP subunit
VRSRPLAAQDLRALKIERSARPAKRYAVRRWVYAVVLAVVGALLYSVYASVLRPGVEVRVGTVTTLYPSQEFTVLNATGYVVAQRKADVASKATGRLEWLEVEEGSRVQKGEVIARLESQDVRAEMEQAAANVEVAKANLEQARAELREATLALERSRDLLKKRATPQEAYDTVVARYDRARAGVKSAAAAVSAAEAAYRVAQVAVEYTSIRAPFDGVIVAKNANIGDVVAPFSTTPLSKGAVVSMVDMDTLEVEADVSESSLQRVTVGQPCVIQLDALPESRFRCIVHRIVPTVDRTKATVLAKVQLLDKDNRILPDMSAKVAFLSREMAPEEQRPVTAVPATAVVQRNGRASVFVVRDSSVSEVPLDTGGRIGEVIAVKGGVEAGTKVVLDPPKTLKDGSSIEVAAE